MAAAAPCAAFARGAGATQRRCPAHWNPLPAPGAADDRVFEGTCADRDDTGRGSLVNGLFGRYTRHYRNASVRFRFAPDGRLEVAARNPDGPARTPHAIGEPGHFACEESRLVLRDTHTSAGGASIESVTVTMTLADDWLVVHWSADEVGVALILAAAGRSSYWTRYRRLPRD